MTQTSCDNDADEEIQVDENNKMETDSESAEDSDALRTDIKSSNSQSNVTRKQCNRQPLTG